MSTKRASAMSKINDFATTEQIKNAASGDDAVTLFLKGQNSNVVAAPGTTPSVTSKTITGNVAGREEEVDVIQKGPSTVDKTVTEAVGLGQGLANKTYEQLSNVPIPGGIGVPLTILFILFLILLPVNGHTRLMWLWLSLTGQAEIGGPLTQPTQVAASPSGTTSYSSSPSTNPNQAPSSNSNSSGTSSTNTPPSATKIVSTSKHTTVVHTNTAKTHGTSQTHKGGGPGPGNPIFNDPTAPIAQSSYSHLLLKRNGYE